MIVRTEWMQRHHPHSRESGNPLVFPSVTRRLLQADRGCPATEVSDRPLSGRRWPQSCANPATGILRKCPLARHLVPGEQYRACSPVSSSAFPENDHQRERATTPTAPGCKYFWQRAELPSPSGQPEMPVIEPPPSRLRSDLKLRRRSRRSAGRSAARRGAP